MKRRILVLLLTVVSGVILTPYVAAQNEASPERKEQMAKYFADIQERLKLTPEQTGKVRPVVAAEMQKLRDLREKYGDPKDSSLRSRRKMAQEFKSIQSETNAQLSNILTKDQMKELDRIRDERRERMRERR